MSELRERLEALVEANNSELQVKVEEGWPLSDDEAKDVFLSALEEGKTIPEAAKTAQRTATWFRARRRAGSRTYDVDFAIAFDEITSIDGPYRENLSQRALTALVKACEEGNVRAAEKILAAYHGDFKWMRPPQMQGDLNIETLIQIMPGIPTPLLEQMREALVAQRELPVIDA